VVHVRAPEINQLSDWKTTVLSGSDSAAQNIEVSPSVVADCDRVAGPLASPRLAAGRTAGGVQGRGRGSTRNARGGGYTGGNGVEPHMR